MRSWVPRPLAWLLAAVFVTGTAWTVVVPPFQSPDEDAHVAYVQTLVELHRRPADDRRTAEAASASREQDLAQADSGFLRSYQRVEARPAWSAADEARWLRAQDRRADRRDGGGANAAARNLPVYY